jgi:hypothetical protein
VIESRGFSLFWNILFRLYTCSKFWLYKPPAREMSKMPKIKLACCRARVYAGYGREKKVEFLKYYRRGLKTRLNRKEVSSHDRATP